MTSQRILAWTPAAIVFDCDGTLMDTERHWTVARGLTIDDFGITPGAEFAERSINHEIEVELAKIKTSAVVTI